MDHKLFVKRKFYNNILELELKNVKVGDKLVSQRRIKLGVQKIQSSIIKSIIFDKEDYSVDLNTPPHHNFFLDNGILSHNSTLTAGVGYYLTWIIAGGRMDLRRDKETDRYINPEVIKKPIRPVRFGLENFVFSPDALMKKAKTLYDKYGKKQVIVYDECRGLDSKGTMKAVNQELEIFFQTCGAYNHVILIVLPNYFKLAEEIATTRSMFLIDCYCDDNWKRGFFNFYNQTQKEWLYFLSKKLIGVTNKYLAGDCSFYGTFPDWRPFDKDVYEEFKQKELAETSFKSREQKIRENFMGMVKIYKEDTNKTTEEVSQRLSEALFKEITPNILNKALASYLRYAENKGKEGDVQ